MIAASRADTLWAAAGFGVQFAAVAARALVLTRVLPPADLGLFFVLRGAAGVAGMISVVGPAQAGLRRVAAAGGATAAGREVVSGVLRVARVTTPAAALATILIVRIGGGSAVDSTLTGVMAAIVAWTMLLSDLVRGCGRVAAVSVVERIIGSVLDLAALTALLVLRGQSSLTVVLAVTAAASLLPVGALATVLARTFSGPAVPLQPSNERRDELRTESWPVAANAIVLRILIELDVWIVAALGSAQQAAVYGVASRVAALLQAPQAIAVFALSGPVAALYAQGRGDELERMLKRTARQAAAITALGFLLVLSLGAGGLAFLFGGPYADALPLIAILGASQVFNVAAGVGVMTLVMTGRARTVLRLSVFTTLLTAAAAFAFMRQAGAVGVACASAGGVVLQNVLAIRAVRRHAGISVHAGPRRA